jgi:hypothetical protein
VRALFAILVCCAIAQATVARAADDDALNLGTCSLLFRSIDDEADVAVRDANREIARLRHESEIAAGDPARTAKAATDLAAAEALRADILEKQHVALNSARRRCDVLRDAERKTRGS